MYNGYVPRVRFLSCVRVTPRSDRGVVRARAYLYFILRQKAMAQEANDLVRYAPCTRIGRIICGQMQTLKLEGKIRRDISPISDSWSRVIENKAVYAQLLHGLTLCARWSVESLSKPLLRRQSGREQKEKKRAKRHSWERMANRRRPDPWPSQITKNESADILEGC
jgi:hypothetical protein